MGGVRDPTFHQQTNRQINLQDSQQTPVYTPPPPFVLVGGIIRRVIFSNFQCLYMYYIGNQVFTRWVMWHTYMFLLSRPLPVILPIVGSIAVHTGTAVSTNFNPLIQSCNTHTNTMSRSFQTCHMDHSWHVIWTTHNVSYGPLITCHMDYSWRVIWTTHNMSYGWLITCHMDYS